MPKSFEKLPKRDIPAETWEGDGVLSEILDLVLTDSSKEELGQNPTVEDFIGVFIKQEKESEVTNG